MPAPATLLKAGLSAGAALLLLTACGGSDDEQSDAGSGSASAGSSSAASSGAEASGSTSDEDVQAFCTEAESVFGQISDGLDAAEPTDLMSALDRAVAAFDQVDPPTEISADWDGAQQGFVDLRSVVAGADLATPEGQASVQQAATDLQGQAAQVNLDNWISANCDNA
jgi:hypothetical protein